MNSCSTAPPKLAESQPPPQSQTCLRAPSAIYGVERQCHAQVSAQFWAAVSVENTDEESAWAVATELRRRCYGILLGPAPKVGRSVLKAAHSPIAIITANLNLLRPVGMRQPHQQ